MKTKSLILLCLILTTLLFVQANAYMADLQEQDEIIALDRQVKFLIEPKSDKNQASYYIADFTYFDLKNKAFAVEDAKGVRTPAYILKKKAMYNKYGIDIKEV